MESREALDSPSVPTLWPKRMSAHHHPDSNRELIVNAKGHAKAGLVLAKFARKIARKAKLRPPNVKQICADLNRSVCRPNGAGTTTRPGRIFSFGATVYEMSADTPFARETDPETIPRFRMNPPGRHFPASATDLQKSLRNARALSNGEVCSLI